MSKNFDFSEFEKFAKNIEKLQQQIPSLMNDVIMEIGNEILQGVKDRTPESDNNKLKNGWKVEYETDGNNYNIIVKNDVEYTSQIEYGHSDGTGQWIDGKYMLTITQDDILNRKAETIATKKFQDLWNKIMG